MVLAIVSTSFLAKLLILAIFTPLWLPIAKELWNEVNESLVEDGGVLGKELDQKEVDRVLRDRRRRGASLVSTPQGQTGPARGRAEATGDGGRGGRRGPARPAPRRRGF